MIARILLTNFLMSEATSEWLTVKKFISKLITVKGNKKAL